jgi:FAD/FMN-containing dehydrogenase
MKHLKNSTIDGFRAIINGNLILPGDPDYDSARQIWNGMIDRKPALIVRCTSTEDIIAAVRFAQDNEMLLSIRGGGHNIAGNALCDDGLVIDLSLMKNVSVNLETRTAEAESGCTLADFDAAVQAHGLATPVGINSTTGLAGLTLGGGFGWLSRKYGMTVDNLLSARVILADGSAVTASQDENEDLFWALRGGGGNFGVVSSFKYQLHTVGPEVLSGLIVFPFSEARAVLTSFARFSESMPDEMNVWMVTRKAPPLPFLPIEVHGKEVVVLALCYIGDPVEGDKLVDKLYGFGTVLGDHVGMNLYTGWQQAFDPLLAPGARNYWKSHNFSSLSDGAINSIIEYAGKLPSPISEIFIGTIGGQTGRVAPEAMAYPGRDANYVMNVHCRWESAADDERCIAWAREFFNDSKPFASAGAYMNFMTAEESDRIPLAYGRNYKRLMEVKKKYDPDNFFRVNQNIKPA